MPRAAKKEDEEPMPVASNSKVKEYAKRLLALKVEIKEGQEAIKDLMKEAKDNGVDTKALKQVVKLMENPLEEEYKSTVNYYMEASGQTRLFV